MLLPAFHRRWLNQIDWQDVESETKIRHGCDFYWLHTSGMLWIENLCLYFLTFAGPWPVQSSWSGRFGMQMGWVGISCFHANVGAISCLEQLFWGSFRMGSWNVDVDDFAIAWMNWAKCRKRACLTLREGSNIQLQVSMDNPILTIFGFGYYWLEIQKKHPDAHSAHWCRKPVLFAKESSAPQQGP